MKVGKAFTEILAILDRQRDQEGAQRGAVSLDDLPPVQVGFESLGATPDRAQRAQKVFHAEARPMKANHVDGVVVAKSQVLTAVRETKQELFLTLRDALNMMRHIEGARLSSSVPINPPG
jgi:hypothetical protein